MICLGSDIAFRIMKLTKPNNASASSVWKYFSGSNALVEGAIGDVSVGAVGLSIIFDRPLAPYSLFFAP